MNLLSKILTITTSALLAAGFLVASPSVMPTSASAETIISQLGIDIDGDDAGDASGVSVSLSSDGTRVAIGSTKADEPGNETGQVRVFDWDGAAWVQIGDDINGERDGDNSGFSVSLSGNGARVAIGAQFNDEGGRSNAGHVRVFELDGTSAWTQVGVDIDGEAQADNSGVSVSMNSDGSRVAIGANLNDGINGADSGHVRVFDWDGAAWTKLGSDIDGEAPGDQLGRAVSLSNNGSRVAIGGNQNDGNGTNSGHVRVFDWDGAAWVQTGGDIDGEAAGDRFGFAVSLMSSDGSRVAIGAIENQGINGAGSGHVRVFQLIGGVWTKLGEDIDGEAAGDKSGVSVSLSSDGTRVAIGAYLNDNIVDGTNRLDAGHVRLYDWNGSAWTQVGGDIDGEAAGDYFGYAVALNSDGTRVAIGAYKNDGNGSDSGHVRLYSIVYQAPAPYSGPLPTNYSDRNPSIGDEVTISGLRLNLVTSCTIDGVTAVMSNQSADSFTIAIPAGLQPGLKNLVITSSAGTLTVQDALTVSAAAEDSSEPVSAVSAKGWTKKLTDSSAKIYAKDVVGAGKVQIFFNGKEIAWVNATSADDPKLRTANDAQYLVRTVYLVEGQKNVLEVHVDGIRIKRAAYSH